MDLRLFFSWQTDSDTKKLQQKRFIKECIETAIKEVNKELKYVNIEYQEGVKGISGSSEIIPEIEDRIKKCHIFIGDLTFINQETCFTRFCKKIRGIKHKTTPNPNVLNEYSRFLSRDFMEYQGFCVLNTKFGDPNVDVSLMPVDMRGKRFPITFKLDEYNAHISKEKYDKERSGFIKALTEAIKECAKQAVYHLGDDIKPFNTWERHKSLSGFDGGYIQDGLEQYLEKIKGNKENLRIIGLSGLGKTRMVMEAFKDNNVKYLYAYIDCQVNNYELILEKLPFMFEHYKEMVLIFDNCDIALHDRIIRIKKSNRALNPIITIYNDPDERSNSYSNPLRLQKDFNEVTEKIIDRFSDFYNPHDKEKLLDFADGIPMMAQLLIEGLRSGESIGVVNDTILMNRILGTEELSTDRQIIQSIALFDNVGYYGDLHREIEFIAGNKFITSIDKDKLVLEQDFDRVIRKYLERKIIEQKGKLISIRPIPIALYLIREWIEQCSDNRLSKVIESLQNSEIARPLVDSFANQFKYMGHNVKARNMLNELLGVNSPFETAEVIKTEMGSRLFRSFVEVNPKAVSECLWNIIGIMDIDSLKNIKEGRRNLVWTIEKICFDPNTFDKGAEMMLLLAMAENEQISNNATGQFLTLFPIYLPATATSLEHRLKFLQQQQKFSDRHFLLIKAIDRALRTRNFIYFRGAEQQGLEQLSNYTPRTKEEIFKYFKGCLNLLMDIIDENDTCIDECSQVLENNLPCLCEAGYDYLIIPHIKTISKRKNYDWEKMLDTLYFVLNHKDIQLTINLRKEIEALVKTLSKDDFFSRFSQVEKKNRWIVNNFSYEETLKRNKENYEELAKEMASNSELYSVDVLKKIYSFNGLYISTFGSALKKLLSKDEQKVFIVNSLEVFDVLNIYKSPIFIDFVKEVEEDIFAFAFEKMKLLNDKTLLFACVGVRNYSFNSSYVEELFQIIKENKALVSDYEQLWYYMPLDIHPIDEILYLFERILSFPESFKIVIHMSMMLFSGGLKDNIAKAYDFIEEEISKRFNEFFELSKDDNYWYILQRVLEKGTEYSFAQKVMHNLLKFIDNSNDIFCNDYRIKNCMRVLVNKYFDEVWTELSATLISDNGKSLLYYKLQTILGSQQVSDTDKVGILFQSDHNESLFTWCAKFPLVAPEQLMKMSPLYENEQFSTIVIKLLDLYGEQESVLTALTSNMRSYSWIGSVVPLYEKQYKCIEQITTHKIEKVRLWAIKMQKYLKQQIEEEKNRDAEGILSYRK